MSLAKATSEIRAALSTLNEELAGWLRAELRREEVSGGIASLEGYKRELDELRKIKAPEPWLQERMRLLAAGADIDKERLAALREEQQRHEEATERLLKAERLLFRFADEHRINAEPLMRLLGWKELDNAEAVLPILRRIGDALDREEKAAGEQPGCSGRPPGKKGATVNERMAAMLQEDPSRLAWSAAEWAAQLSSSLGRPVSAGAVKQTATWTKQIIPARALNKADRAGRGR
jgi:hypothetical protein